VYHVGSDFKVPDAAPPFKIELNVANLDGGKTGKVIIQITPEWAPLGAARLKEMIQDKFLDNCRFFRVINGFMAQFGIHGDPATMKKWSARRIKDDVRHGGVSNKRGFLSFAMAGPNTRTTQLFINFRDNSFLDSQGFTPIGEVIQGMDIVDKIFVIGEGAPSGKGPAQDKIQTLGNSYLNKEFPKLSYIKTARFTRAGGDSFVAGAPSPALVRCEMTVGTIDIEVHPEWAPIGAARFLEAIEANYFDGCALFRAIKGFLVQFGIGADPKLREEWRKKPNLIDDPLRPDIPIKLGTMAYAGGGKNSRSTQVWIAFDAVPSLGTQPWETPFAQVVGKESLENVKKINTEYGDKVDQGSIWGGYEYLKKNFPKLDYIKTCKVVRQAGEAAKK
jgi:peptidyl-prolyl cis-trans isomerase A (cyclophilin A)